MISIDTHNADHVTASFKEFDSFCTLDIFLYQTDYQTGEPRLILNHHLYFRQKSLAYVKQLVAAINGAVDVVEIAEKIE